MSKQPMLWCKLCQADAFVKARLGSKVILDCDHVADAGAFLIKYPPEVSSSKKKKTTRKGGPTSREVWAEHRRRAGQAVPSAPVQAAAAVNLGDPRDLPERPAPVASFDSRQVASKISDLLRRK